MLFRNVKKTMMVVAVMIQRIRFDTYDSQRGMRVPRFLGTTGNVTIPSVAFTRMPIPDSKGDSYRRVHDDESPFSALFPPYNLPYHILS